MKFVDSLLLQTALRELAFYVLQTNLLQLIDCYGNIHHFVGVADRLGNAVKDLAVVHLQHHADAELKEYALNDLDKLNLIEQRT